ncbi:hypothetical protein ACOME3_002979 [Neoechinorhynchus agilis]
MLFSVASQTPTNRDRSLMGKLLKSGRIVVVLAGRYAGRKAVIVRPFDESTSDRAYPHALVVGIDRYPRRVTRHMTKKKQKRMLKIKPFIKCINYNHLMPTRFVWDSKFDGKIISKDALKDKATKRTAKLNVQRNFSEALLSGKKAWFFTKLRF